MKSKIKPNFIETIRSDLSFFRRGFYSEPKTTESAGFIQIFKFLLYPEYSLVFWYRVYSRLCASNWKVLRWLGILLYFRSKIKYASDISPYCSIGIPFKLGHHMGIVIGPAVVIGSGVYIFNDVTLGNKNVGYSVNKMPVVGDSVLIGTGAKLLGDIHVSDNSVIGANSLLINSTMESEVWAGVPAIKLR